LADIAGPSPVILDVGPQIVMQSVNHNMNNEKKSTLIIAIPFMIVLGAAGGFMVIVGVIWASDAGFDGSRGLSLVLLGLSFSIFGFITAYRCARDLMKRAGSNRKGPIR